MHYAADKGACVILFYSEISTVKFMEAMKSLMKIISASFYNVSFL